jgi:PAS domain S-box-containing protein
MGSPLPPPDLSARARTAARSLLPWAAGIYAAIGGLYVVAPPLRPATPFALASFATAAAQLALWAVVAYVPDRLVHGTTLVAALLAQAHALSFVVLTGDPAQSVVLVIAMLGAAAALLDLRASASMAALGLVAWTAAARDLPAAPFVHWAINLSAAAMLAVAMTATRVRAFRRIETDVSLQQLAEERIRESEERNRLVVDTALDAVVTMNAAGEIVGWNRQAERTFGWTREEVLGRSLADTIVPEVHRQAHRFGVTRLLSTGTPTVLDRRIEITGLRRGGSEFPVELAIAYISSRSGPLFTAFLRDITERRRAEAEIMQAKEAAESAARAKADFLATMSHEIRSPLHGIFGMTELALDTADERERRDCLLRARRCTETLSHIINDVLDFSKIDAGRLSLESVELDPRALLDDVLDTLAVQAERRGLELVGAVDAALPRHVRGDPGRLRQILMNLGTNALKVTQRGEVVIRLLREPAPEDGRAFWVRGEVRDTGIGIPPEKQSAIFEAFTQADSSTTREFGGTGLGLAISNRLVSLMGGRMGVESTPGEGSTFWFTVPLVPGLTPFVPLKLPSPLRILVVDDCAPSREHLLHTLGAFGCQAAGAADAVVACLAIAEAAVARAPIELLVVDVALRGAEDVVEAATGVPVVGLAPWRVSGATGARFVATVAKPVRDAALFEALVVGMQTIVAAGPQSRSATATAVSGASRTPLR